MPPFVSKRRALHNAEELQQAVLKKIPPQARPLIETLLTTKEAQKYIDALRDVPKTNPEKFIHLFRRLARSTDPRAACMAIDIIGARGSRKDLPLINRLMYSPNAITRNHAIMSMAYCNEPESSHYLHERMKHADVSTRKTCVRAISFLKPRDYELYAELSEHPPFKDVSKSVVKIGHIKDGSTTVLLGGKLYDKAIIRGGAFVVRTEKGRELILQGITPQALEAWKKAFEFDWKTKKLDHNPIEPILKKKDKYRIYKNKDGTFRISTGVIKGTSLAMFFKKAVHKGEDSWEIARELKRQKDIIDSTLKELNINHSHDHPANYMVEMVEGKPRVYIIDFDAAFIKKVA